MPRIRKSFGIICCRKNNNLIEMLMVKKSTTYHFCEFVFGRYKKNNEAYIKKLFNNMTYHEKMDILSLDFNIIWYRIYKENPVKFFYQGNKNIWYKIYLIKKNKFENNFLRDSGNKLKKIISDSCNVDTQWEFPKGKRDESKKESDIETAIREFNEETGVEYTKYKILWNSKPYIETFNDLGITYQNIYYFAESVGIWDPLIKFQDKNQISEISSVKWVSKNDLLNMKLEDVTYKRLMKCFNKIIIKYKNAIKNKNIFII